MNEINDKGTNIVKDNNFLFAAFENRLIMRLVHIFEKYKIPMNKNIIKKNMEENLINNLTDLNEDIIIKYINLLSNYEKLITENVKNRVSTDVIKKSTMSFVDRISQKNKTFVPSSVAFNFIEFINSIIYVYDNKDLNVEVVDRINKDVKEIVEEFNRNNYNFVIESINVIIKNIIKNI